MLFQQPLEHDLLNLILFSAPCREVKNDLAVGSGLKYRSFSLKSLTQGFEVRQISVVAQGEITAPIIDDKGLDIQLVF